MRCPDVTPRLAVSRSLALAGLVAAALLAAIAIGGLELDRVAAASAKSTPAKKVLKPVKRTKHALVFKMRGVQAARVRRATARLRIKQRARAKRARRHGKRRARRRARSIRRTVSIARVRRAAERGTPLRIRKQPRASGGRLVIGLADPSLSEGQTPSGGPCTVDPATFTAPGCEVVVSDTAAARDPEPLWGDIECEDESRVAWLEGGDPHPTATGAPQPDGAHRRLTVFDGDDYYGERCELGDNDHRHGEGGGEGTFALYREGQRRITFASMRMGPSVIAVEDWQVILQMKQAQPSDNGGGTPILELQVRDGELSLESDPGELWETQLAPGVWTRIALDVTYSQFADRGQVKIYVDANGDGDALDEGEVGGPVSIPTLRRETPGDPDDGLVAGDSIPSHLRTGLYHDESIDCPTGCSIELDNVQVVG